MDTICICDMYAIMTKKSMREVFSAKFIVQNLYTGSFCYLYLNSI